MNSTTDSARSSAHLTAIVVSDPIDSWERAGFASSNGTIALGGIEFRFGDEFTLVFETPPDSTAGTRWSLDGVACRFESSSGDDPGATAAVIHPNGIGRLDHLVVFAGSVPRFRAVLTEHRIEVRRERDTTVMGKPATQLFAWIGPTILEVVIAAGESAEPAQPWGLAFESADLRTTGEWFGSLAGTVRPAVQRGREILPLRHEELGFGLTAAVMSPHVTGPSDVS